MKSSSIKPFLGVDEAITDRLIKWVFFDFDGTLSDSLGSMFNAYILFLDGFGCTGTSEEFSRLNGPTLQEIVAILKDVHNLSENEDALLNRYKKIVKDIYAKDVQPAPGADKVLGALKESGYSLAIVSSGEPDVIDEAIVRWGWRDRFDLIVCGDQVVNAKPAPDIYLKALMLAGVAPWQVVAVEDSENGIASAHGARIPVVQFSGLNLDGGFTSEVTIGHLSELSDLPEILREQEEERSWQVLATGSIELNVVSDDRLEQKLADLEEPIKAYWDSVSEKDSSQYHDGVIFHMVDWKMHGVHVDVQVCPLKYRHFLYNRDHPESDLRLHVIGISGITIRDESNSREVLLGQRSRQVTQYSGAWELVPSGSIDATTLIGRKIDIEAMICQELEEETGYKCDSRQVSPFALLLDMEENIVDIGCELQLLDKKTSCDKVVVSPTGEYTTLQWVTCDEAYMRLKNASKVVPTSRGLLEAWHWMHSSDEKNHTKAIV